MENPRKLIPASEVLMNAEIKLVALLCNIVTLLFRNNCQL